MTQTEILKWLEEGAIYRGPNGLLHLFAGPFESRNKSLKLSDQLGHLCWQGYFDAQPSVITCENRKFTLTPRDLLASLEELIFHQKASFDQKLVNFEFRHPEFQEYEKSFVEILERIQKGEILKAVPVGMSKSSEVPGVLQKAKWISNLLKNSPDAHLYGIWSKGVGVLGASPEILFHLNGERLMTVAIAGTIDKSKSTNKEDLFHSSKEREEHYFVVEDITQQLDSSALGIGVIRVLPTEVIELPHLFHLKTTIEATVDTDISITELTKILHPTSALGVYPRDLGYQWLRNLPGQAMRGFHGAPIGFRLGETEWVSVVAIRGIQWDQHGSRVGAGGGLVRGSKIESEWNEISLKRDSVFKSLGL